MSAAPRIPADQVAFVIEIITKRRAAAQQLKKFPTNEELAAQLGCSKRWIEEISRGRARVSVRRIGVAE